MVTGWYTPYRRELFLFVLSLCVKTAVFLLLFQWFVVSGHLPAVASHYPVYAGDSLSYYSLSQNLLHNQVYSLSESRPFIPESFRLPGYPFFLYAFQFLGFPVVCIIVIQMMLGSGTVVLTYLLGKRFLSEKVAFIAALLLCVEPTSVFYSTFVMSDTLFVFLLLLSLYLFFLKRQDLKRDITLLFVSGVVFGLAILTRAIALYLPPLLAVAYCALYANELRPLSKTLARFAVFAIGIVLIIAPWSLRNYSHYGAFDISSTHYVAFTQINVPLFYAYSHGTPLGEAYARFSPFYSDVSLANKPAFQKLIHDTLEGNFFSYLKFHLIKTLPFFVTDGIRDINRTVGIIAIPPDQTNFSDMLLHKNIAGIVGYFISPSPNLWMLLAGSIPWILVSSLWLFGLGYVVVKRLSTFWFVCIASGIILYFALLTGPLTEHRYRMPAAPFMLLMAVQGAVTLRYLLTSRGAAVNPPQSV